MKAIVIYGVMIGLISYSCQHHHADHAHHQDYYQTEVRSAEENSAEVKLNNGKKWKASASTTNSILLMKAKVKAFDYSGGSIENLQASLDAEFENLLKTCTMTGEAHEQLHAYLVPLKRQIDSLENPSDSVAALKHYLDQYKEYFE